MTFEPSIFAKIEFNQCLDDLEAIILDYLRGKPSMRVEGVGSKTVARKV